MFCSLILGWATDQRGSFPGWITSIITASDMSSWGVIDQQLAGLSCAALTAGFVWLILHIFGHYSFLVLMLADISTCVYCSGSRLSAGLCYLVNKELLHFKNTELWHTKNKRQSSCCGSHSAFISPPLSLSGRQGVHAHSPSFPSCSQEWSESLPATDHLKPSVCV